MKKVPQLEDAYVIRLEDENDELRERVRQMEEALGYRAEMPLELGLTASEAKVLGYLYTVEMARKDGIMAALYADRPNEVPELKIADVYVCKIRNKVKGFGIQILTRWGSGWYLTKESKIIIKGMLPGGEKTDEEASADQAGRNGSGHHEPGAEGVHPAV